MGSIITEPIPCTDLISVDLEETMTLIMVSKNDRIGLRINATTSHSVVGSGIK